MEFAHIPVLHAPGRNGEATSRPTDPLTLKAYQYDLVCNGLRDCPRARLRKPCRTELMVKAFEKVGLSQADVEERFGGLYRAFQLWRARRMAAWQPVSGPGDHA